MQSDDILWIKNVKSSSAALSYNDVKERSVFSLHWPALPDCLISRIKIGDIILLEQCGYITHIVTPISREIAKNNDTQEFKNYHKCQKVYCLKQLNSSVADLFGKKSCDYGGGSRIQTCLRASDSDLKKWQQKTFAMLRLDECFGVSGQYLSGGSE